MTTYSPEFEVAHHMTTYSPEFEVESMNVCPVTIPNKADLWVLRFKITNLNNRTSMCIDLSEASIFSCNGTDLLAKGGDLKTTCVGPLGHRSMNITFVAEGMNQADWSSNESRFFDLRLTSKFIHTPVDQ